MAARKKPAPKTTAAKAVVTVTGPKRGRRRIGRDFGREPVAVPLDGLSKGDLIALRDDPALTCEWPDGLLEELNEE